MPIRRFTAPDARWSWNEAACRGEPLTLFFGHAGERQVQRESRERRAKQLCAQCPVKTKCLDHAVARPEKYGIWGGLNADERDKERRRRRRRAA